VHRRVASLAAVGLALALGACGDDDEGRVSQESAGTETSSGSTTATAPTQTAPVETVPEAGETAPEEGGAGLSDGHGGGRAAPEDRPGGAGDEIPASTQALFTGRAGKISPPVVRVPPFIAVRVQLRSGDGAAYELGGGGEMLRAAGGGPARPVVFDGLRPGKRLVLTGTGGRVIIEASAEPGP